MSSIVRRRQTAWLFVVGDAATLITNAGFKGQLCSWLDCAGFWEFVLQNGDLTLWDIPHCIVGPLSNRVIDERQGADISADQKRRGI
jgi:hypothetical protein